MTRRRKTLLLLIGFSLILCFNQLNVVFAGSSEFVLGEPKANMPTTGLVPHELIEKIALKKAQEKWGQGAIGKPFSACDDDGDIVAYMFPFAIGSSSFPGYSEILSEVKKGRQIAREGLQALTAREQQAITQKVKEQKDTANGPPPHTTEDQDASVNIAAKKYGQRKMIGAGQYGTIVVSARYDRFPVPLYMHYLPPYFYNGDLAASIAANVLRTTSTTLERIYFLERTRSQYFEFSSNGLSVLINSYSLEVEPAEKVLTLKGKKSVSQTGEQTASEGLSEISDAWRKIEQEVQ
jgi:hypothetical protein